MVGGDRDTLAAVRRLERLREYRPVSAVVEKDVDVTVENREFANGPDGGRLVDQAHLDRIVADRPGVDERIAAG